MAFRSTLSPNFDCIVRAGDQGFALGNNTLAVWFRLDNVTGAHEMIEVNAVGGGNGSFDSAIIMNGNQVEYSQRSSANQMNFLGGTTITANTWHHAALTYDGTTLRGYLDGATNGTSATVLTGTRGNWANLQVGPALGYLQDALFFSRALTAGEIQQLYAARRPHVSTANLEDWLPCFPGSGRLEDYSGKNRDFSNSGTPTDPGATIPLPPRGWGGSRTRIFLPTASGVVNLTGTATSKTSGAASVTVQKDIATSVAKTRTAGAATVSVTKAIASSVARTRTAGAATITVTKAESGAALSRTSGAATVSVAKAISGGGTVRTSGAATVDPNPSAGPSVVTKINPGARRNSIVYGTRRPMR